MLNRIMPDHVMTMDDHTGLVRIMMDEQGLVAHRRERGAADRRPFPARDTRRFICVEITRRRSVGHMGEPDIAETVHRDQRIPACAHVPAGNTQQVPNQPWPEERPDMVEEALEIRMHGRQGRQSTKLSD